MVGYEKDLSSPSTIVPSAQDSKPLRAFALVMAGVEDVEKYQLLCQALKNGAENALKIHLLCIKGCKIYVGRHFQYNFLTNYLGALKLFNYSTLSLGGINFKSSIIFSNLLVIAAVEPYNYEDSNMKIRDRSWRRLQHSLKDSKPAKALRIKPEKNWKLAYTRSEKLHRAKMLGKEYPLKPMRLVIIESE